MAKSFEELDVYRLAEDLADHIWDLVIGWEPFAKYRVGGQLVEAADSISANISEGSGRGTFKDNCHFARVARGSFFETRNFLRRAYRRKLLTEDQVKQLHPLVRELGPCLNGYIRSLSRRALESKQKRPSNE